MTPVIASAITNEGDLSMTTIHTGGHAMLRRRLLGIFLLTVLFAGAACSRSDDSDAATDGGDEGNEAGGASGEPIRIGVPGAFSGPSGPLGEAVERGLELQATQINDAGGLLDGRPIELVYRDHEANPDKGITNVRELLEREQVVALVGETSSGVALAEAPIVNQAGIPWVITVSTGTKVTEQPDPNSVYRVSLVDKDQTEFALAAATERYSKIALLTDTSGYGQGGLTDLLAAMEEQGIEPVANETYAVGDTDMTPQISSIQASGADVIINWGLGPEAAQIRRAMEQVGADIPMIGSWGLSMPNYMELGGDLAEGTYVVQAFSFDTDDPQVSEVREAYEEEYGTDRVLFPNGVANSYDGLGLLAAAIDEAGSTEPEAISEALQTVSYDGLIKDYEEPWADGHEALGLDDMFLSVIEQGDFVRVED